MPLEASVKISAAVYAKPEGQRPLVVEIDMKGQPVTTRALRTKNHASGICWKLLAGAATTDAALTA